MNYILALLLIVIMFSGYGQPSLMTGKLATIPSSETFYERDVILGANGKNVYMLTDLMDSVEGKSKGDIVNFTVYREGKRQEVNVKLLADTNFKSLEDVATLYDALGIYYETTDEGEITQMGMYLTSVRLGFFQTIGRSFEYSFKIAGTIFTVLGELITGSLGLKSVGVTVTTISLTAQAIKTGGLRYLLNIASLIGVNLAVFNLLPIPALDGSRTIFTLIEWIRKKPINRRVEGIIHTIGFVLLLLFAVVVDLQQCF